MFISTVRFEAFKKEFAKLVKFAAKVNSEAPTYTAEMLYHKKYGYVFDVEVSGVAPKYADWEFIARIDNIENIIQGAKEFPSRYYEDHGKCEHCNINHQRVKTYIIKNNDTYMEVGGACVKQFIDGISPQKLARHFDLLKIIDDFGFNEDEISGGSNRDYHNDLPRFISYVKSFKDKFGYVKASDMNESTATTVYNFMTSRMSVDEIKYYRELSNEHNWATQHQDYALAAIEHVSKLAGNSSFMINLQQICRNGFFTERSYKILAAIVQVYDAHILREQQLKTESLVSSYVGKVKDKVTTIATIQRKRVTFGAYSLQTWLLMKDSSGNVFTWNASKELEDVLEGFTIEISGTVKCHKDYNNIKQTVLTRCKYQII